MKNKYLIGLLGVFGVTLSLGLFLTAKALNSPPPSGTETVGKSVTFNNVSNSNKIETTTLKIKDINPTSEEVIYFPYVVNKDSVDITISALEQARLNGYNRVYLVIDSPGGSVFDGAKLISYMKSSKMKIDTVCETMCASMAFHIFETGNRRLMLDKSILMAHPASGGAQGTVEEMKSLIDMIKIYVDRMDADVAKRVNIPLDQFKFRVLNNIWLEARDAVKEGFADEIVNLQLDRNNSNTKNPFVKTVPTHRIIDLK